MFTSIKQPVYLVKLQVKQGQSKNRNNIQLIASAATKEIARRYPGFHLVLNYYSIADHHGRQGLNMLKHLNQNALSISKQLFQIYHLSSPSDFPISILVMFGCETICSLVAAHVYSHCWLLITPDIYFI